MPGVPRIKRCKRCRRIKIKCDENWPTCTPCARAEVPCSGPPTGFKFVHNGCHADKALPTASTAPVEPSTATVGQILTSLYSQSTSAGATFDTLGPPTRKLRTQPTTVADRVAARLVRHLSDQNTKWNLFMGFDYMNHLPSRLGGSAALRDCVALACSAWAHCRQGLPVKQWVDPGLYVKALRRLQDALDDPQEYLECETLAAVTVLGQFEVMFDTGRPLNRTNHAQGIQALMKRRGPPRLDDTLGVALAEANKSILVSSWAVDGGENFYLAPQWKERLEEASRLQAFASSERRDCYTMDQYCLSWPGVVHELREITNIQRDEYAEAQASRLRDHVITLEATLKRTGEDIVTRYREEGLMKETPEPETPFGSRLDFSSVDALYCFITYIWVRTILNRILHTLDSQNGQENPVRDVEHKHLCRQAWMCIPFVRGLGPFPSTIFASAVLFVSYEGADEREEEYLLDFIMKTAEFKERYPKDREVIRSIVLNSALGATGRAKFYQSSERVYENRESEAS